jgi:hypothetical protein
MSCDLKHWKGEAHDRFVALVTNWDLNLQKSSQNCLGFSRGTNQKRNKGEGREKEKKERLMN